MKAINLKKWSLALLGLTLSVCAFAQQKALIVNTQSQGQVMYALSTQPRVTFTSTDVVLTAADVTVTYPLSDHVAFTFGDYEPNAVDRIKNVAAVIACTPDKVQVSNLEAGTTVTLFDAGGRTLQAAKSDAKGRVALPLAGKGVYLLRVGKMTVKLSN